MKESNSKKINPELKRRVDAYVQGRLGEEEIDELWIDLIQDSEAISYLKTVANLKHLAELKQRQSMTSHRPGASARGVNESRTWYWAIAAVLLLAGMFGVFQYSSTVDQIEPIDRIEMDYYRSSDDPGELTDNESVIREAIALANRGLYPDALDLLEKSLDRTEEPSNRAVIFLNAGSILYNQSSFEEAAERFRKIVGMELEDTMLQERAYWYLGNAYFQMNRFEEAREAFKSAYELNGAYRRVAERYIAALPPA